MTTSLEAAAATKLIQHTDRCRHSKLTTCVCDYDGRMQRLADRFEAFAADLVAGLNGRVADTPPT